jgi:ubiquinone/menaquinone biosynthesis C-methylase UbiE
VDPKLPFPDESFDVVTCVVSVDYLIKPLEVFKEVGVVWCGGCFPISVLTE